MCRQAIVALTALTLGSAGPALAQSSVSARVPRIRPLQAEMAAVIESGVQRSPTFRALVEEIERSDVVVYVYGSPHLSRYVGGGLSFVGASPSMRYLKVVLRFDLTPTEMVWMLGHELQHAVEVVRNPGVRTEEAFLRLYLDIGMHGALDHTFETADAQDAGRQVRRELFESMRLGDRGQTPR
jgi:hypothetical protein